MRLPIALVAALVLVTPGCGGGSDPAALSQEGFQELGAGDFEAAEHSFAKALEGMDSSHADYLRVRLGHVEAQARIAPARAKDEFLALATAMKDKVTDRHYNQVGGRLADAGAFPEATAVLEAGLAAFPESKALADLRKSLGDRAKASGDSGALDALKGLGYVGD